jgi:dihydroorotase-like cyclic amidohydrolase
MEGETISECHDLKNLLERKQGAFRFIPNGIPGVETRLPLLYTGALATGRITPQRFVELTSTNPAKLVRIRLKQSEVYCVIDRRTVRTISQERGIDARIRRRFCDCKLPCI